MGLKKKIIKMVNILIEGNKIKFLKSLLFRLKIQPNSLMCGLIKIAKLSTVRVYIKELSIFFTDAIYMKFIKYNKYDYFLFCKLPKVMNFVSHMDRLVLVT